ncbi:MAG: CHAT domain-containing protein [Bacteroidia bacterium]
MHGLQQFVFVAVPQSPEQVQLDYLNAERDEIGKHIFDAKDRFGRVTARMRSEAVTHASVTELLRRDEHRNELTIFHYAGHANGEQLFFQDSAADANGLAELLSQLPQLKLVFLNGCETLEQIDGLLERGVKAVLATSRPINDAMARVLSAAFYRALAQGKNLGDAFKEAQEETRSYPRDLVNKTGNRFSNAPQAGGQAGNVFDWGLYAREDADLEWKLTQLLPDPEGEMFDNLRDFPHFASHKKLFGDYLFEKAFDNPRIAFAIHGKKDYGQSWLVEEGLMRVDELLNHDQLAFVDYDARHENTIMILLRDIAARLEISQESMRDDWEETAVADLLGDEEYQDFLSEIAQKVYQRLATQPTLINIYNAAASFFDLLEEIVEGIWNPLSDKLEALAGPNDELKPFMLIVTEEDFELAADSSPLCEVLGGDADANSLESKNLYALPAIDDVEAATMLSWIRHCDALRRSRSLREYRDEHAITQLFQSRRIKPTPLAAMSIICEKLGFRLIQQDRKWKLMKK